MQSGSNGRLFESNRGDALDVGAEAWACAAAQAGCLISTDSRDGYPPCARFSRFVVMHLLGIERERLTYRYARRNLRLTDVSGEVAKGILA